jgi:hypothetical protein
MICPNPNCGRIVSPFDDKCQHCGTPLETNPVKDYEKKAGQIIKDAESRAEDIKEQIRSGFKDTGQPGHIRPGPIGGAFSGISTGLGKRDLETESEKTIHFGGDISPKGWKAELSDDIETMQEIGNKIQRVIDRSKIEILQIEDEVFKTNPHIRQNYVWRNKAEKTNLYIDWDDISINAGAGPLDRQDVELSEGKKLYRIILRGGYVYFVFAIATAFIGFIPVEGILWDEQQLIKVMRIAKDTNGFGPSALNKVFKQSDIKDTDMRPLGEYAFSLLTRTVGHEFGHICYGHIHGPGYEEQTIATNHGGEFDADSFAYTIIGDSDDSEEKWLSLIMLTLTQLSGRILKGENPFESYHSHPAPFDRFRQAIFRFPKFAEKYKISEDWALGEIRELVVKAYGEK